MPEPQATVQADIRTIAQPPGAARGECRAQAPDHPGPSGVQLAVKSTGIDFDTASCAAALSEVISTCNMGAGNVLRINCRRDGGVVGFLVDWDVARRGRTLY